MSVSIEQAFAPVTGSPSPVVSGHDKTWTPVIPIPEGIARKWPTHPLGVPSWSWVYRDQQGRSVFVVCRFDGPDGKTIRPLTCCRDQSGTIALRWQGIPNNRPLYNLDLIVKRDAATIVVVEGEKTADAANGLFAGVVSVTSSGGSQAVAKTDWTPLRNRHVIIWPDNDDPGKRYRDDVIARLVEVGAASVRVVDVPATWPVGWDLADDSPEGVADTTFAEMLANARLVEQSAPVIANDSAIDLALVRGGRAPAPALPVDLLGPGWARLLEDLAAATNSPIEYSASAFLAVSAAAIGRARCAVAWRGWRESVALWFANLGEPSSGKSSAADPFMDAIRQIEAEEAIAFEPTRRQYEEKVEMAEALAASWKERVREAAKDGKPSPPKPDGATPPDPVSPPRMAISDSTIEAAAVKLSQNPRGLVMLRDEISGFLGGMDRYSGGGAERAFYLESYGGRPYRIDRKSGPSILIPGLLLSMYGSIQPDKFSSLIAAGDDDGLASRFLYVWPEPRPFERPKNTADGSRIFAALRRLRSLPMAPGEHGPVPVDVHCTEAAAGILEEFCREKVSTYGSSLWRTWRGKGRGVVLRLSLIIEFLDWAYSGEGEPPTSISDAAMMRAVAFYEDFFSPMAARSFDSACLPESERDAGALARWIVSSKPECVVVRDVYKRLRIGGMTDAARTHRAISELVEAGWLVDVSSRDGGTVGRKQNRFAVNPDLWPTLKREGVE